MNARQLKGFSLGLGLCALFAASAMAGSMNYGDHMGDRVIYEQVREDNSQADGVLLYSMPQVVGDSLLFNPVSFFSQVVPGPGANIIDAQMTTEIQAKEGFTIKRIDIAEAGDYTIIGLPGVEVEANVGAAFFWSAFNAAGDNVGGGTKNMTFTSGGGPNGGEFTEAGNAVIWHGLAQLDLEGMAAIRVHLTFNNTMSTLAGEGGASFIKKEEIGGIVVTPVIPEPTSIALLAAAGVGLAVIRRRR